MKLTLLLHALTALGSALTVLGSALPTNTSTTANDATTAGGYPPTFYMRLGTTRQNVGPLRGQALYDKIFSALSQLCPFDKKADQIVCKTQSPAFIKDVAYKCGDQRCFDSLAVSVSKFHFNKGLPGIDGLLKEQVAGIFKTASEDEKNCYWWLRNGQEQLRYCNVGNFVGVREDWVGAYLDVTVGFYPSTSNWHFDCPAIKEASTKFFDTNVRTDLMKVLQVKPLNSYIECTKVG